MTFTFACVLPAIGIAAEQTCKYVDAAGNITYSNVPQRESRKVFCMDPAPVVAPRRPAGPPATTDRTRAEAGFPRVDSGTQKRRDTDRRRILEEELAEEQRLLDAARRAADDAMRTTGGTSDNQASTLQDLRNAVGTHERNLAAIRRELASIR